MLKKVSTNLKIIKFTVKTILVWVLIRVCVTLRVAVKFRFPVRVVCNVVSVRAGV